MIRLFRKVLRKVGLHRKFVTKKIEGFWVTFQPATDIGRTLFQGIMFEKPEIELACNYIKADSTVLDIGSNIGLHSLYFSKKAKDGLVLAFEPQPVTFSILEKNIVNNNINNIVPLNLAISDSARIADFYVVSDDAYSSLIDTGRKKLNQKIKVLCSSIDGLLGTVPVDFVKIDVEGLELNVLHSMSGLIERSRPVIFCEIYKGVVEANNPLDTINFLREKGYIAYRVIGGKLEEFLSDSKHEDRYYNYFFIPHGRVTSVSERCLNIR